MDITLPITGGGLLLGILAFIAKAVWKSATAKVNLYNETANHVATLTSSVTTWKSSVEQKLSDVEHLATQATTMAADHIKECYERRESEGRLAEQVANLDDKVCDIRTDMTGINAKLDRLLERSSK